MSQPLTMFIACHRPCPVPAEPCYLPLEVGAALHPAPIPGFTPDNTGDNIKVYPLSRTQWVFQIRARQRLNA